MPLKGEEIKEENCDDDEQPFDDDHLLCFDTIHSLEEEDDCTPMGRREEIPVVVEPMLEELDTDVYLKERNE